MVKVLQSQFVEMKEMNRNDERVFVSTMLLSRRKATKIDSGTKGGGLRPPMGFLIDILYITIVRTEFHLLI